MVHYHPVRIVKYAMIEAPALFGIAVFMNTCNQYYLIIATSILGYLVVLRPSKSVIKNELKLNSEEYRMFEEA